MIPINPNVRNIRTEFKTPLWIVYCTTELFTVLLNCLLYYWIVYCTTELIEYGDNSSSIKIFFNGFRVKNLCLHKFQAF